MKRLLARVAVLLAALAVALCLVEVSIRLFLDAGLRPRENQPPATVAYADAHMLRPIERDGLRYMGTPGASVTVRGVEYRHNSLGLRDDPVPGPKPAGVWRLLVLGDSNTYGWGVPVEQTFCHLLELRLEAERDAAPVVDVVNAAFPGYNTGDQLALFRFLLPAIAPDAVLVVWMINDLERLGFHVSADGFTFVDPLPVPARLKPLLWESFTYRKVATLVAERMKSSGSYVVGRGENQTFGEEQLRALIAAVRAAGLPLAIADLPWLEPSKGTPLIVQEGYIGAEKSTWLARLAASEQVPLLPLLGSIAGEHVARYWYLIDPPDHHPNALAHEKFAAALLPFVREHGLVPLPH